jgi:hypothetical protein
MTRATRRYTWSYKRLSFWGITRITKPKFFLIFFSFSCFFTMYKFLVSLSYHSASKCLSTNKIRERMEIKFIQSFVATSPFWFAVLGSVGIVIRIWSLGGSWIRTLRGISGSGRGGVTGRDVVAWVCAISIRRFRCFVWGCTRLSPPENNGLRHKCVKGFE